MFDHVSRSGGRRFTENGQGTAPRREVLERTPVPSWVTAWTLAYPEVAPTPCTYL